MYRLVISTFKLIQLFPDNESARQYIEKRRWNGKPVCPKCDSSQKITARQGKRTGFYICKSCKKEFTVRTGTIFERSHIGLHKWIYAIYMVVTSKTGISSLQLSKEIGITQKSTWFMLQRIRGACDLNNGSFSGIIEIDKTDKGEKERNKHNSIKHSCLVA